MNESYEVIVIGGGPAGATVATLLADYGHSVLVLEREVFPRFHIGESLMPETFHTFKRLGMIEKLEASDFPRKESVQFVSGSGRESQPFYFTDRDPGEWSTTWQVRRDVFDQMMLDNAAEHGAEVHCGVRVREVLFESGRAAGVLAESGDQARAIRAQIVVDATGTNALLARQLKLLAPEPRLRKAAIYAHYRGALRDGGRDEGATIILHTPDRNGWFWFIPLPDDIASIGLVGDPRVLFADKSTLPAERLEAEIQRSPGVKRRLDRAERVTDVHVTSDFSYRSRQVAGDGWVLIGDAYGFLDPIYSSGVLLAMRMGEGAADSIHAALSNGNLSGERLGSFASDLVAGMDRIRKLIYAFYDPNLSFGRFIKEHPHLQDHLVRLLIGDLFSQDVDEIFGPLGEMCDLADRAAASAVSESNPA